MTLNNSTPLMTPEDLIWARHLYDTCKHVIVHACQVYTAEQNPNVDYSTFCLIGADEVLCKQDEVTACTAYERLQWVKWRWLQWATSPSDLTFTGCLKFILGWSNGAPPSDDEEDIVTFDDVMEVLRGKPSP